LQVGGNHLAEFAGDSGRRTGSIRRVRAPPAIIYFCTPGCLYSFFFPSPDLQQFELIGKKLRL
jgi:hypothetical protein